MRFEEFAEAVGDANDIGLSAVPRLCRRFGGSYEATVYRLATASDRFGVAGRCASGTGKRKSEG
jgi:hypothetical protein